MHNATAITTGSANQRSITLCIRLWIDVTFRGVENSYFVLRKAKMQGKFSTGLEFANNAYAYVLKATSHS